MDSVHGGRDEWIGRGLRTLLSAALFVAMAAAVLAVRDWAPWDDGSAVERGHRLVLLGFFCWLASRGILLALLRHEQYRAGHVVVTLAGLLVVLALDVVVSVWALATGDYAAPQWPALTVVILAATAAYGAHARRAGARPQRRVG